MKLLVKAFAAGVTGLMVLVASSAFAKQSYKPDYCGLDHDHRSHASNYYDYYDADRYYRAGPYRKSGISVSFRIGDRDYDDRYRGDRRYNDRRYSDRRYNRGKRHGYRGDGRVVNREIFDTRHRARIVLIEEVVRTRRGPRLICSVEARGPEARYVPRKRLKRIARRNCSDRARVKIYA